MVQYAPVLPEVVVTGTLHVLSAAEPLWLLAGDDGVLYTSMTEVPADMLIDGLRVTVSGCCRNRARRDTRNSTSSS